MDIIRERLAEKIGGSHKKNFKGRFSPDQEDAEKRGVRGRSGGKTSGKELRECLRPMEEMSSKAIKSGQRLLKKRHKEV